MPHYRISESGRILPDSLDDELPRLPMRLAGGAFLLMAAVGWISLASWSFGDPSINHAVDGSPQNLLGPTGASLADILLQILGLASIAMFLPPAAWGIALVAGDSVANARHQLAMWTTSLILIASALSILPTPASWPLPNGTGGLIGDFGKSVFLAMSNFVGETIAMIIGASLAGLLGLWALLRASGIGLRDMGMLLRSGDEEDDDDGIEPGFSAGFFGYTFSFIAGAFRWIYRLFASERPSAHYMPPRNFRAETEETHLNARILPRDESTEKPERDSIWQRHFTAHGHSPSLPDRTTPDAERVEPYFEGHRGIPAATQPQPSKMIPVPAAPQPQPHQVAAYRAQAQAADVNYTVQQPQQFIPQQPMAQQPAPPQQQAQHPQAYPQTWQPQAAAPIHEPYTPHYNSQLQPPQHPQPVNGFAHHPLQGAQQPQPGAPVYTPQPAPAVPHYQQPFVQPQPIETQQQAQPAYANENFNAVSYGGQINVAQNGRATQVAATPVIRGGNPYVIEQAMPDRESSVRQRPDKTPVWEAEEFMMPPLDLLASAPPHKSDPEMSDAALGRRAELLQSVLEDFRIKGQITGVHPGPVITLYEFEPARGTKSSRIIGLADDIARSMSATSARVAVIPGRDALGIELPNRNREIVYLRELLESKEFLQGKGRLQLALGKTIGGDPVIVDLARMPHLLIAGTTGSGKSVAINTMILSLLYRLPPEECRFIMIDPKMLELSVYDGIPHLLTPVVTDPHKAIRALKWTVNEMNVRYERMCKLGVRNIMGFNQKVTRAARKGEPLFRSGKDAENFDATPMPYIVVVIDEMADLMMVAGKDIEFAVQRLSQMARAAGIHLIMATQRPSVDVITGTIKANFPSRISFQVTSKIDSRTILGEQGAEQLLGAGDMLTMAAGGRIMRAHGPFVSDDEVETVTHYLREQGEPAYMDGLVDDDAVNENGQSDPAATAASGDDVYSQAIEIVMRDRRPTTSYLQRRLGIGYNRAASLIEQMEADGIVSAPNRTGKREVLAGEAT